MAKQMTMESKISEVYATPIGRDTIGKVLMQLGVSDKLITNQLVGNMKLSTIAKLAKGQVEQSFFDAILNLLNAECEQLAPLDSVVTKQWWKEDVFLSNLS